MMRNAGNLYGSVRHGGSHYQSVSSRWRGVVGERNFHAVQGNAKEKERGDGEEELKRSELTTSGGVLLPPSLSPSADDVGEYGVSGNRFPLCSSLRKAASCATVNNHVSSLR